MTHDIVKKKNQQLWLQMHLSKDTVLSSRNTFFFFFNSRLVSQRKTENVRRFVTDRKTDWTDFTPTHKSDTDAVQRHERRPKIQLHCGWWWGHWTQHDTTRQSYSTVCPADAKTPERHRPDTGFFGFYRSVSQPQIYIFIKQTNSKETAAYLIKSAADSKHPPSLFTASERSYSGQLSLCVCTYVSYDKYDWKKNVIPKSHTYLNRLRFPSVFPPILHRWTSNNPLSAALSPSLPLSLPPSLSPLLKPRLPSQPCPDFLLFNLLSSISSSRFL